MRPTPGIPKPAPGHDGPVDIVRIQEADVVAGCGGDALVHRLVKPAVGLRNEVRDPGSEFFHHRDGSIGRATVDHEMLDIAKGLPCDRCERMSNGMNRVKADGDDRDFHYWLRAAVGDGDGAGKLRLPCPVLAFMRQLPR